GQMGYSVMIIGIASIGIYMGVSVLSDRLFKKNKNWRVSRVYVVGIAMIVGAVTMASLMIFQNPIWVIIAMCLAKGLTYAIIPIGPTIMINEMPERGGLMTSILTSSGNIAGIVGPMITGFIVGLSGANKVLGYNYSVLFMAVIVFIFAILFITFVRPGRNAAQVESIPSDADSL